jgi:hypothetical protein
MPWRRPRPQDKDRAGVTPHGLMPGPSRSSQDSVTAKTTANQPRRFRNQKKPARLSWRASYAVTKSRGALGAIRDCHEDTELRLTKC